MTGTTTSHHIAAVTDRGLRRAQNEDAALATVLQDGAVLLAVADGVGGAQSGDVASTETIQVLRDELCALTMDDPADALRHAFDAANARIRSLAATDNRTGMATTLVAAIVRGSRAWIGHAGDSRAGIIVNGHLETLTQDHSLVAEQVLAGFLTDDEAEHSDYQNVITRAVGIEDGIEADITGPIEVPAGSVLLVYSDGLYRAVTDEEIASAASLPDAATMARQLIDRANLAGGPDNISVAVYVRPDSLIEA
jgi:protein phosphatase